MMNEKSIELAKDILRRKLNAKHQTEKPYLTESDLNMIDIICDNIYTLGISDGMPDMKMTLEWQE